MRILRVVAIAALAAIYGCGSCKSNKGDDPDDTDSAAGKAKPRSLSAGGPGLQFRLSDGSPQADKPLPAAKATTLDAAATKRVLDRLPKFDVPADDEKDFALREASLPPPRTGMVIKDSFPPADAPGVRPDAVGKDPVPSGPLAVVRRQPEGDIPIAPNLSVTFSQPMIPVTSHADLAKLPVPVTLTPEPKGKWRWVGTRTVLFEPDVRFPMATEYRAVVAAGTKSATGETLGDAVSWTFTTPSPVVKASWPTYGPQVLDPLIFIGFDQRIDPAAVLRTIELQTGSGKVKEKKRELRLASKVEVEADEMVSQYTKQYEPKLPDGTVDVRWLAFKSVDKLPGATTITVRIGPGTPSAEGDRTTSEEQSFSFETFGPLKIEDHRCSYEACPPGQPWMIRFSNPLDVDKFDDTQLTVTPPVKGMKTAVHGDWIYLYGNAKGRTTYTVTLSTAITDKFGQHLDKDEKVTFDVGSAEPRLTGPPSSFIVIDPASKPHISVHSINMPRLKVRINRVAPGDYWDYMTYLNEYYRHDREPVLPGKTIVDTTIAVKGEADELIETRIDLAPGLKEGFGQLVVHIEDPVPAKDRWQKQRVDAWVQVTKIGIDAFSDSTELVGWATALADGKPLAGVAVAIVPANGSEGATTDADGLVRLALPAQSNPGGALLVATHGADTAILPEHGGGRYGGASWVRREQRDRVLFHILDDRAMYRPGENVHVKGWVRRLPGGELTDLVGLGATSVSWRVVDSRRNEIGKGEGSVSALGGFDLTYQLPPTVNLGHTRIELMVDGNSMFHSFQVQEFRCPEYEVSASASDGPFVIGGGADVTVSATYFAGGGLANAAVNWTVSTSPGYFSPPNRSEYSFGAWTPYWSSGPRHGGGRGRSRHYDDDEGDYGGGGGSGQSEYKSVQFPARTTGAGQHHLRIDFDAVDPARPTTVVAQATVTDVNRQAWAATASLLVHPADHYVGLKTDKTFVEQGRPVVIDGIVVDLDGKAIKGRPIAMRAVRLDGSWKKGEWVVDEKDAEECKVPSGDDAVTCRFNPKEGGSWRVTATIEDEKGRKNVSELAFWVAGGKVVPARGLEMDDVTLIPDAKEYAPGDTAHVLVQAPFYPAEGLMTLRRDGIIKVERFTMTEATRTLDVPITEAYLPNVWVQVNLVGSAPRLDADGNPDPKLPRRPAFGSGSLSLPVPAKVRQLTVDVTPVEQGLEPGGETDIDVVVKDRAGKPVAGAELAVIVVDEAILALTGYRLRDPLGSFYVYHQPGAGDVHLRAVMELASVADLEVTDTAADPAPPPTASPPREEEESGGSGARGALDEGKMGRKDSAAPAGQYAMKKNADAPKPGDAREKAKNSGVLSATGAKQPTEPIAIRSNFDPLALFAPEVSTDANGRARVHVKVPDNLTRYRVMVVAVSGVHFYGTGESSLTARLPLMLRPSAPRFLNFGDTFELPIVVQNQTKKPLTVDIAVRAANLDLGDGLGRQVTIPAGDRVEVRFPAAAKRAGIARFQVGVVAGKFADASELSLPVWTPATTEAFATYGEVDQGAAIQPIAAPTGVVKQFGGLEISTSSTAVAALTDAVLYLTSYKFECAEQVSSRILAVAALKDVLGAFKAEGLPSEADMMAAMARDIDRLKGLQNYDGGFSFWERDRESWPWVSTHVAHALARAQQKGFAVPEHMLTGSRRYLADIERHIDRDYWTLEMRQTMIAYALYVRAHLGDVDTATAHRVMTMGPLDNLPLEAAGWLLVVLAGDKGSAAQLATLLKHVNNRATETAGAANFVQRYADGGYLILESDRRADGVVLEGLIAADQKNALIPKVVRGLMAHRTRGHWGNTQENAFVLLALDRYFAVYEKVTPNFVASVWLGEQYAGKHAFRGRTTEQHEIAIPMSALMEGGGKQNLIIDKQGAGRMYYRIGMRYAPADLKLPPADHGFVVEREYEAVDDPKDVTRDADGTWRVKAGARVRVRLTMVAEARRYHVALVDPLPAGLEPMNPALAVTGDIPQDKGAVAGGGRSGGRGGRYYWYGTWYEHQNMRDERVEAFTSLLWEGVWTYSYVARATTPGNFVVPPTKAEEMYAPETFGRSAGDRVIVE